jgi:phosphatidate cytidylyltransferase
MFVPARVALAAVLIPVLLAIIIFAPVWSYLVVLGLAVLLAGDELLGMARGAGIPCGRLVPLAALAAVLVTAWTAGLPTFVTTLFAVAMVIPTFQLASPTRPDGALAGTAVALLVPVYLGLGATALGWLRQWPENGWGIRFILLFLGTIWIGDSGAYYVGKNFGRHPMAPRISPKKTWEGLAGGVTATIAGAFLLRWILGVDLPLWHTLAIGAILAVTAPVGDLVESQLKRATGVKDSSGLLPGHGGLLDRTDSLFFSAPPVLGYLLAAGILR